MMCYVRMCIKNIHLNELSLKDLRRFPCIGVKTASKIKFTMPIKSMKSLLKIAGIGPVKYNSVCNGINNSICD
jgi:DNA uptake protein ComE-like DNA-binding protein